jgi:hypothetical protein
MAARSIRSVPCTATPLEHRPPQAATGRTLAIPDALWANRCVIAEADSRDYHLSPQDWNRTQERHTMLTALGFAVLHFAPTRIKADPEAVCGEVIAALTTNTTRRWPRSVTMTRAAGISGSSPGTG